MTLPETALDRLAQHMARPSESHRSFIYASLIAGNISTRSGVPSPTSGPDTISKEQNL